MAIARLQGTRPPSPAATINLWIGRGIAPIACPARPKTCQSLSLPFLSPTRIFSVAMFVTPTLSLYVPLALAPLLGLIAVLVAAGWALRRGSGVRLARVPAALFAAMAVLALASALWAYDPGETLDKLHRLVLAIAAGIIVISAATGLDKDARATCGRSLLFGMVLALLALAVERAAGGVLVKTGLSPNDVNAFMNQFNRGLTVLSILIWPAIVVAARIRWLFGAAMFVATLGLLFTFRTNAADLALCLGAAVFVLACAWPRIAGRALIVVVALSVLGAPFVEKTLPPPKELFTELDVPRSAYHRLLMWDFTTNRVMERPVLGWGFNASRIMPGAEKHLDTFETALPLHPHNAALQWWLELGVLGALLGAGLVACAANAVRTGSRGRMGQAGASATIVSAMTVAFLSYGIWQGWWMAALFLTAGYTAAIAGRPPSGAGAQPAGGT